MRASFATVGVVSVLSLAGALGARLCGIDVLHGVGRIDGRAVALAASVAGGLGLALVAVAASRWLVGAAPWARSLARDLGTGVSHATDFELVIFALASGIGEEILFRGLGVQLVGVTLSSLIFAVAHQKRGVGRIGWMAQALVFGLAFGWLFWVTGELVGCIVGHVAVNVVNLREVRRMSSDRRRAPRLGGLLARGSQPGPR